MKPYAIEAGFDNGDGTYSIHIRRLPLDTKTHKDYRESEKLLYTKPQITELSDEEIKEFIEDIIDAMGLSMEFTAVRKSGWDIGIKKFRELSKASVK